ncbi:unnamed protein product [Knipowitschia caucasica]
MCDLKENIMNLRKLFEEHSKDGNTISTADIRNILARKKDQNPQVPKCPEKVQKIMQRLEKDEEVDFKDFMKLLGAMSSAMHGWHMNCQSNQ